MSEQNENQHLVLRDASNSADCSIEIRSEWDTKEKEGGKLDISPIKFYTEL